MLNDLLLVTRYFEGPDTALYERDLEERYGVDAVRRAIRTGLLEHRWVPCGKGRRRCVCWLSAKGRQEALHTA